MKRAAPMTASKNITTTNRVNNNHLIGFLATDEHPAKDLGTTEELAYDSIDTGLLAMDEDKIKASGTTEELEPRTPGSVPLLPVQDTDKATTASKNTTTTNRVNKNQRKRKDLTPHDRILRSVKRMKPDTA